MVIEGVEGKYLKNISSIRNLEIHSAYGQEMPSRYFTAGGNPAL